ncbi:hypothetical protein [Flavobacterium sp.]|uniref:hypothetical protein n=1 Tax=Flavobacterium sp. TaxID=239 RepID=UPI003B9C0F7F
MFYYIQHPTDLKIIGNQPQIDQLVYSTESFKFQEKLKNHYEIDVSSEFILPKILLFKKTKLTDHIFGYMGEFMYKLIVSDKFMEILKDFRCQHFDVLPISVETHSKLQYKYNLLTIRQSKLELIDFKNSKIKQRFINTEGLSDYKEVSYSDLDTFLKDLKEKNLEGKISIINLAISNSENLDFFFIRYTYGSIKYIVSDRLKTALVNAGITGIEFQPTHYSLNEWYASEEREKIYGT